MAMGRHHQHRRHRSCRRLLDRLPGALVSERRRGTVYLFALAVALSAVNLFWTSHETNVTATRFAAQQAEQRAAERRAGRAELEALCLTFGRLGQLHPPAGNPQANPSRAYLQHQAQVLNELGADLGCGRVR
jgi:hypothetical protein